MDSDFVEMRILKTPSMGRRHGAIAAEIMWNGIRCVIMSIAT